VVAVRDNESVRALARLPRTSLPAKAVRRGGRAPVLGRRRRTGRTGQIIHIYGSLGYPLLYLILLVESVGIPSPSEFSLVYAGVLASEGKLSLPLVLVVGALGSISGANIAYWIARRGGRKLIVRYGARIGLNDDRLAKAEAFFANRGDIALLVGRLISGVRALISYPAGLFEMPYPRFLGYTSLGALLWPLIAAGAGYLVGPHWRVLLSWLGRLWIGLAVLAVVALVGYIYWRRRRGKATSA